LELSALQIAIATVAMAVGALVQGSLGFGLALVVAPVLVQLETRLVPGPLMIAGIPFMLGMAWRERKTADYRGLGVPLLGQFAGVLLALAWLSISDVRGISLTVGLVVLAGVGFSISGLKLQPTPANFLAGGTLAGFMATTSSMPGPPLALIHQHVSPARMRAVLTPFFVFGNLLALVGLVWVGYLGEAEVRAGLWLMPGGLLGLGLSNWTAPRVNQRAMRISVLIFSFIAALTLIYRSL
jgi:uncharacterized membrane protein YfcA